ncbi:MAG: hypothetical protein RMK94_17195, partial [Armatimonadota bacterium]|nr:hypothetical protein [Armatimonadota bacterium]
MGSIIRIGTRDEGRGANDGTRDEGRGTSKVILVGVVSGVLLGNIHPYALAPIGYALVLWFFVALLSRHLPLKFKLVSPQSLFPSPQFLISGALIALPAFAAAGWQAFAILGDPIYRAEFQFHLETPPIWDFVLNYGIFLFLALLASIYFLRQSPVPVPQSLLIAWLIGAFLAVYLTPTAQPRKLIEGAHLPMCLLAAWAWHQLVLPKTVVIRRYPTLVLLLIGGITPLTFGISQVRNFLHNDEIALH